MPGIVLANSYAQLLWQQIDPNLENFYNGAVEAILTFVGTLSAFLSGNIQSLYFEKFSMWILMLCSLIEGVLIICASRTDSIILVYVLYVIFGGLYTFMITMAR